MDDEAQKAFLAEFDTVAKAAIDIAARAKKVPDTELSSIQYVNLTDELCAKVQGLKRLAVKADILEGGNGWCF